MTKGGGASTGDKQNGSIALTAARLCVGCTAFCSLAGIYGCFRPGVLGLLTLLPDAGTEGTEMADRLLGLVNLLTGSLRIAWMLQPRNKTVFYLMFSTYPMVLIYLLCESLIFGHASIISHVLFFGISVPILMMLLLYVHQSISFEEDSHTIKTK